MSEYTTQPTENLKRLERTSDRLLAGVAGGLGRYFDLNPAFFRIGFVVLTVLGGAGILVYIAAALVIPAEGESESIAARTLAQRRERPWPVVGLGLAAVALLVLLSQVTFWPVAGAGWAIVLVAGLAILWASSSAKDNRRLRYVIGTLVTLAALALAAVVAAVVVAFTWFDVSLGDGVGDRTETPANVQSLQPVYHLGVGNLRVDLSNIEAATPRHVTVKVGIGSMHIVVPPGTTINAHAKVGTIHAFGHDISGRNSRYSSQSSGKLVVDATVGAGRIDVVRAVR
jgi:phage shock protein PspC (stress-responsive transcriptional regulator)